MHPAGNDAYSAQTKPTWCLAHVDEIYRTAGLERIEEFGHPVSYVLTRCLRCSCEAHYRFNYILELNDRYEAACRACYWASWSTPFGPIATNDVAAAALIATARERAEQNGFDYLGPCLALASHRTRCRRCGKIIANRVSDMGWGCATCR